MIDLLLQLRIPWRRFRHRARRLERGEFLRLATLGGLGVIFWVIVLNLMIVVLEYFLGLGVMGNLLAKKLLSMVMLVFMSFLLFSAIVNSVSTFFLAEDLELLNALPLDPPAHFLGRFLETLWESSYMLFLFGLPVLIAYGVVFKAPPVAWLWILPLFLPFLVIPVALGVIFTMMLVNALPAQRLRDVMMLLGVIAAGGFFVLIRFLRPERLTNADEIQDFARFFASLDVPSSYLLPSEAFSSAFFDLLLNLKGFYGFNAGMLALTALASVALAGIVYKYIYVGGFQKAQEARRVVISKTSVFSRLLALLVRGRTPVRRALLEKDIKLFFRDPSQWSQLILLAALMGVYLYSLGALPLDALPGLEEEAQNGVAFINLGLAGFTISALAARFVFPAVSLEGRAIWLVRSAPIGDRDFVYAKFWIYLAPLTLLALTLIVLSNLVLQVVPFIMILCVVTMLGLSAGIVSLAIGFGARFPLFRHDNIAKVPISYGGVMYMLVSLLFIGAVVALEIYPVATVLRHGRVGALPITEFAAICGCFALALAIVIWAVVAPLRMGIRALERMETI